MQVNATTGCARSESRREIQIAIQLSHYKSYDNKCKLGHSDLVFGRSVDTAKIHVATEIGSNLIKTAEMSAKCLRTNVHTDMAGISNVANPNIDFPGIAR